MPVLAQQVEISGNVVSAADEQPLEGVTVTSKLRGYHTMTNDEGQYSIATQGNDILVFTSVGFVAVEVPVNNRSTVNVTLKPDESVLQEVEINAGYYTVKDRERTGSISRITAEEISKQPIRNPMEAMIGRMPGVFIEQGTGVPGGGFRIQVRGRNSISSGNRPLYIVDGVPFPAESVNNAIGTSILLGASAERGSPLDGINPSDIESIEVLKDADATAIYGSRGANGVVLITTKKGAAGKPRLQAGYSTGYGEVANRLDLLNTEQWLAVREQAFVNDGFEPSAFSAPDLVQWDRSRYTDWHEFFLGGTARSNRVNASLSGGSGDTRFLLSGNYMDEGTVYPVDGKYRKYGALFSMNHVSHDNRLVVGVSLNAVGSTNSLPTVDFTEKVIQTPPNAPAALKPDGTLNWEDWTVLARNPMEWAAVTYNGKHATMNGQLNISYRLYDGLELKLMGGYNRISSDENTKTPFQSADPYATGTGSAFFGKGTNDNYSIEPQMAYQKQLLSGRISALLGASYMNSTRVMETISANGFTNAGMMDNISFAPDIILNGPNKTTYRYAAAFGRFNYFHQDKYIINLTARRDGSTRFGPDNRFANFGALGVAWLFGEERLIKDHLSFLSFGKIRGSFGVAGNDQIADYGYMHTYSATDRPFLNAIGVLPDRHANPDYSWETNRKLELALEVRFLDDRIGLEINRYRNRSSNQLLGYPLTAVTGMQSVQQNLAATVQNSGWEFSLSTQNIRKPHFSWDMDVNLSIPRSKLLEYPDLETSAHRNSLAVGQSMNVSRRYIYTGINPATGRYDFMQDNGGILVERLFDMSYRFYGGLNNIMRYRSIYLSVFFQFTKKQDNSMLNSFLNPPGSLGNNQPVAVMEGEGVLVQKYTRGSSAEYRNLLNSNFAIVDASFVRLKNVALSYDLPKGVAKKAGAERIGLSVTAQNVLTWTGYDGLDPETANSRVLPPLRTFTFGVDVQF